MKIKIDKENCIGCSLCEGISGWLFQMRNNGKVFVKNPHLIIYCFQKPADEFSADAIILEKKT